MDLQSAHENFAVQGEPRQEIWLAREKEEILVETGALILWTKSLTHSLKTAEVCCRIKFFLRDGRPNLYSRT